MIGLLNYGAGNYGSVKNALEHLGHQPLEVRTAESMNQVSHLILPGVGSFPAAMNKLNEMELIDPLCEHILDSKKPFLGICVGMQLLADRGFEFEETPGLGWIGGQVQQIEAATHGLSVPHIGWNEVEVNGEHHLLKNLSANPSFYFVHSFAFRCEDKKNEVATCSYGEPIVAVVEKENIFGVQFHPEKSQRDGLQLLKNFTEI